MIAGVITWLVAKGVPAKAAKPLLFAGLALLVVALLFGAKCAYDKSVIEQHEARQEAATAKADRKADQKAADQRRVDDARAVSEAQEIKEAINEARNEGRDPRAAYYECVRLQQSARRERKPPPEC
jgi:uncharacterized protein YqfA (UPF0365 family)